MINPAGFGDAGRMSGSATPPRRLRPMGAGDIIDEAIKLYRNHFKLFLTIGALVYVPVGVIQLVVQLALRDSDDLGAFALTSIVGGMITFFAYLALNGAMIHAASEAWHEREVTLGEAWNVGLNQMWRVLGLGLIFFFALFFMMITIIGFPIAIYFFFAWLFCFAVLIIERSGIRRSLSRSRELVSGHWWRVVGIMLLVVLIQSVISGFFSIPGALAGAGTVIADPNADPSALAVVLSSVGSTIGEIVVLPISYCSYILLYYDQRIRKEGFDLELAAQRLEQGLVNRPNPGLTF
jgi:hypothetical protein